MMPYVNPHIGLIAPGLIWWALAWDAMHIVWGPKR